MPWAEPEYSRQKINEAGKCLISPIDFDNYWYYNKEYNNSLQIINNWRDIHSYPLNTFQINLRRSSHRFDERALVAQRTKRLSSIELKLTRFPNMKLTQMQDIGGYRAVLNSANSVFSFVKYYEQSNIKHERSSVVDYISSPRNSGYRGIHLIYKYYSDKPAKEIYNGLKIEMQLRSRYQHAWATAVETIGTFIGQSLKSSMGEAEWLRFFALMGTAIALREKCAPVPDTPVEREELIAELRHYARLLQVEPRLRAFNQALRHLQQPSAAENAHFYLLELDTQANIVSVTGFKRSEFDQASEMCLDSEKRVKNKNGDAVLVSVDSLASLRRAYPNYFADTRVFVNLMTQALTGRPRRIYT